MTGLDSSVTHLAIGSGSSQYTCAVKTTGAVKCWGENASGQLGNGTTASLVSTPVDVCADTACLAPLTGVVAVAVGGGTYQSFGGHTCAIMAGGAMKCWGNNSDGVLGDGTTIQRTTPVNVVGLSGAAWSVSSGFDHACARLVDGKTECWGGDFFSQLGVGGSCAFPCTTPTELTTLGTSALNIAVGTFHGCATTTDGGVKCWGHNDAGQLGDCTNFDRSTPVDVAFGVADCDSDGVLNATDNCPARQTSLNRTPTPQTPPSIPVLTDL